jgi:hypothetical protein
LTHLQAQRKLISRPVLLGATAVVGYLALSKLLLHFASSGGYGYFRDELYYIAASEHLDFGYVDYPPFIAIITAITRWLLGTRGRAVRPRPGRDSNGMSKSLRTPRAPTPHSNHRKRLGPPAGNPGKEVHHNDRKR